ncbi:MAG TPA: hypothetical protein VFL59_10275 [Candidatus Nanopelagicales bacterium]|nr:hypothetical protein [Candidatus Nanopelagicales bacterium]
MTDTAHAIDHRPTSAPPLEVRGAACVPLSWALAGVTTVAAALTVLDPGLLRGAAVMNGSARGTALVMLLGGVPVLVAGVLLARRGSVRALALWIGGLAYLAYNAVMLLFGTPFNALFLAYDAILGLSIWAAIALLHRLDVDAYADLVAPGARRRAVAVFVWVVVALNTLAWLGAIVPGLTAGWPPAFLVGTGLTTFPTYVQDLAFWLPLFAVTAAWLWAGRPWGLLLAPALLLYFALEGVGVAVDQVWGHVADPSSTVVAPQLAPAFLVVAVVCLLLAGHLLAHVRPRA